MMKVSNSKFLKYNETQKKNIFEILRREESVYVFSIASLRKSLTKFK